MMPNLSLEIRAVLNNFAELFSPTVWTSAQILLVGAILCIRKRTVTSALTVMGRGREKEFSKFHKVLNRANWSPLIASRILLGLLVALVPPKLPLVFVVDDHIERRKGKKIKKKGCYRDAVRSSRKKVVHCFGLKWVSVMLVVKLPWSTRSWALPVITALASSKEYNKANNLRHKTTVDWALQMITLIRRWLPDRMIVLVGDGGYAAVKLALCCFGLPVPVILISRLRLDAALYDPPPPVKPGKRGKKPKKGKKQHSLQQRIDDPSTEWSTIRTRWYDRKMRTLQMFSGVSLWYRSGFDPVQIKWVVIRDPNGKLRTEAFFSTNIKIAAQQILRWYILRWNIEVTFEELRAHLGVETQRQWSDLAIERTTPVLFSVFSMVVLMANRIIKDGEVPIQQYGWYKKSAATFSDVIAVVRRQIWKSRYLGQSSRSHESSSFPDDFHDILIDTVCRAS